MEVISGQTAEVSEVTVVYTGWNELKDYGVLIVFSLFSQPQARRRKNTILCPVLSQTKKCAYWKFMAGFGSFCAIAARGNDNLSWGPARIG